MKKNPCTIPVVLILLGMIFMVRPMDVESLDSIVADVPQTIDLAGEAFNGVGTAEAIFTVTSNDGFDVSFSGDSSKDDATQGNYGYPVFTKQDWDASGNPVSNKYDHLETTFGVAITDCTSVEIGSTWSGGANATGMPADLVLDRNVSGSPDMSIGRIMPAAGIAKVHLYAKGAAYQERQSGKYTTTVTCTVWANPQ